MTTLKLFESCHSEADAQRASAACGGGKGEAEESLPQPVNCLDSDRDTALHAVGAGVPRRCAARNDTRMGVSGRTLNAIGLKP